MSNEKTNLAELADRLSEAKKTAIISQEKLKGKEKPIESYLICKNGIVAETDHSGHSDGRVTIHETIR